MGLWCMGASVVVGKNHVRAYVVYSGMAGGCPRTSAGAGVRFFLFICLFKQTNTILITCQISLAAQ